MHKIIKRNRNYERPRQDKIEWEVYIDGTLAKTFDSKRDAIDWVMAQERLKISENKA
jgi:hypothetical protein